MSLKPKPPKSKKKITTKRKAKPIAGVTPTGKIRVKKGEVKFIRDYTLKKGYGQNRGDILEPVDKKARPKNFFSARPISVSASDGYSYTDGVVGEPSKYKGETYAQYGTKRITFAKAQPEGKMSITSWIIDARTGTMKLDAFDNKTPTPSQPIPLDQFRLACHWASTWGSSIVTSVSAPAVQGIYANVSNYDSWEEALTSREQEIRGW